MKSYVPKFLVDDFENWYTTEHLKDAHEVFKAINSSRGWSKNIRVLIIYAYYEFKSLDQANNVLNSNSLKKIIKIYDLKCENKIKRERDIIQISKVI